MWTSRLYRAHWELVLDPRPLLKKTAAAATAWRESSLRFPWPTGKAGGGFPMTCLSFCNIMSISFTFIAEIMTSMIFWKIQLGFVIIPLRANHSLFITNPDLSRYFVDKTTNPIRCWPRDFNLILFQNNVQITTAQVIQNSKNC